jgi:hypothetical protein
MQEDIRKARVTGISTSFEPIDARGTNEKTDQVINKEKSKIWYFAAKLVVREIIMNAHPRSKGYSFFYGRTDEKRGMAATRFNDIWLWSNDYAVLSG